MGPLGRICEHCGTKNSLSHWVDVDTFCSKCNAKFIFSDDEIKHWKKIFGDADKHFEFTMFLLDLQEKHAIEISDNEISCKKFTVLDLLKIIEKQTDKVNYDTIKEDLKQYLQKAYGYETVKPDSVLYWEEEK